jgi:hypothetical protein
MGWAWAGYPSLPAPRLSLSVALALPVGKLHYAMLSLFRICTFEDWTDIMYTNIYGCKQWGYSGDDSLPKHKECKHGLTDEVRLIPGNLRLCHCVTALCSSCTPARLSSW